MSATKRSIRKKCVAIVHAIRALGETPRPVERIYVWPTDEGDFLAEAEGGGCTTEPDEAWAFGKTEQKALDNLDAKLARRMRKAIQKLTEGIE